jgi:hypothetical protein
MVKDIRVEVAEAVVAYAQDTQQRAATQRERTLAQAGPENLKGMRQRGARARVPGKRIKSAHRRASRGVPLKLWAASASEGVVTTEDVRAWRENKKPAPRGPRLKLIKATKPAEPLKAKGGK